MKKAIVFLLIPFLLLNFTSCLFFKADYNVNDAEIVVKDYKYNYANEQQDPVTTKLFMVNSELYVFHIDEGDLYVIRNGKADKILNAGKSADCVVVNDDVYYLDDTSLMHYSLSIEKKERLYNGDDFLTLTSKEDTAYVLSFENDCFYGAVDGVFDSDTKVSSDAFVEAFGKRYELRPSSYSIGKHELVVVGGETEMKIEGIEANEEDYVSKKIVAVENGVVIHNEGGSNLLYFIDGKTGEITNLFSVECMDSDTAMNIYGDKVYLSVYRYKGWGDSMKGMVGYENDTISGTYEIDLKTGESKKISDQIYDALYIFDSTGIYAVEEYGKVYKLDFDGNVIQTIVTSIF